MKEFSLENRVAVVTGALGLIGKWHCTALAEAGANVVVADLDEEKCIDFANELPSESIGVKMDITDKTSVQKVFDQIMEKFQQVEILVNNAAVNDMVEDPKAQFELSRFENYPLHLWQKSIDVNLTGAFLCAQVFGSQMAKQKRGSIINIASTYGIVAPNQSLYQNQNGEQFYYKPPAYSVTKGAVISLTKYLAAYWGKDGVRTNTLSPGGVHNMQSEEFVNNYSSRTPLNKMAQPTDYKGALVFLASEASSYMTGANLVVDGGWTCW
ncbi:MAG: SDR family oxidoreductase [Rhodothermaceae bacterium]